MELSKSSKSVRVFGFLWNIFDSPLKALISFFIGVGIIAWLLFTGKPEFKLSEVSTWGDYFSTSILRFFPAYLGAIFSVVPLTKLMTFIILSVYNLSLWEDLNWWLAFVLRLIISAGVVLGYIFTLLLVFQHFLLVSLLFLFPFLMCGMLYFFAVGMEQL